MTKDNTFKSFEMKSSALDWFQLERTSSLFMIRSVSKQYLVMHYFVLMTSQSLLTKVVSFKFFSNRGCKWEASTRGI